MGESLGPSRREKRSSLIESCRQQPVPKEMLQSHGLALRIQVSANKEMDAPAWPGCLFMFSTGSSNMFSEVKTVTWEIDAFPVSGAAVSGLVGKYMAALFCGAAFVLDFSTLLPLKHQAGTFTGIFCGHLWDSQSATLVVFPQSLLMRCDCHFDLWLSLREDRGMSSAQATGHLRAPLLRLAGCSLLPAKRSSRASQRLLSNTVTVLWPWYLCAGNTNIGS